MKKETARWIQRTHLFRDDEYECSSCGRKTEKPFQLCPCCGARMKGSEYDPSWVDEMELLDALFED